MRGETADFYVTPPQMFSNFHDIISHQFSTIFHLFQTTLLSVSTEKSCGFQRIVCFAMNKIIRQTENASLVLTQVHRLSLRMITYMHYCLYARNFPVSVRFAGKFAKLNGSRFEQQMGCFQTFLQSIVGKVKIMQLVYRCFPYFTPSF